MKKLTKDFFSSGSAVMIGYSSKAESFSRAVYKDMSKAGITVYPVNRNAEASYDIKVYSDLSEVSDMPEVGVILVGQDEILGAIKELKSYGVKKVLVQSKRFIDGETESYCDEKGVELNVGCPLMAAGKGLHRFHGFLAGVK